ncbi:hypothetical protein KHS38_00840 [Mucilaginibacter sp. Bleaf8]|uniref:hypothetical protein n=1 Tax=Mucilaginibacter sp. Bleaf8 TaxID=2834430 RepID=UPI001BCC5A49|nr:hypothetical protein [Mucilaginibacter sp. Bleaf8]MBS7562934.1 hypothetical protein [Mucilaginibacter sp. Bleaf8]
MKKLNQYAFKLGALSLTLFSLAACQTTKQGNITKDSTATTVVPQESKQPDGNASQTKYAVTATGTIGEITPGKDGYMAELKADDGNSYMTTLSVMRLEKKYIQFKTGDRVRVAGDTIHLENKVNILVKEAQKLN